MHYSNDSIISALLPSHVAWDNREINSKQKLFSPTLSASALLPKCQYTDALSNFQPLAKFHQSNHFTLRGPMCLVGAQQERKT